MTPLRAERATVSASLASSAATERRLSPLERTRLAAEILTSYVAVRRALRRAPIVAAVALLRRESHTGVPAAAGAERLKEARDLAHAVTRALPLIPADTRCLMQALVLTRLLARREISAKLVIGARTAPGFFAHAWVEHAGHPVLFAGDGLFDRLVEL
jgi:hypothetical protein